MTNLKYNILKKDQQDAVKEISIILGQVGSHHINCINDVCTKFDQVNEEIKKLEIALKMQLDNLKNAKSILKNLNKSLNK